MRFSSESGRDWVFGYGSLVFRKSLVRTLGREPGELLAADLAGWRRRWSLLRDNHRSEKTFALADGRLPDFILGLNIEAEGEDPAGPVNGAIFAVDGPDLEGLDRREVRYDRVEVTESIAMRGGGDPPPPGRVWTFTAKRPAHFAPEAPPRSVIIARYAGIVKAGFEALGPGEAKRFGETTGPPPVAAVEAELVKDQIPPGNPRAW